MEYKKIGKFTERQSQVIEGIEEGMSFEEIGKSLGIDEEYVIDAYNYAIAKMDYSLKYNSHIVYKLLKEIKPSIALKVYRKIKVEDRTDIFKFLSHDLEYYLNIPGFGSSSRFAITKVYEKISELVTDREEDPGKKIKKLTVKQLMNYFNKICYMMPKANKITPHRKNAAKTITNKFTTEEIIKAFNKAAGSSFLRGEIINNKHSNWRCTFDWIMKEPNMTKVLEGNYDDHKNPYSNPLEGFNLVEDPQTGQEYLVPKENHECRDSNGVNKITFGVVVSKYINSMIEFYATENCFTKGKAIENIISVFRQRYIKKKGYDISWIAPDKRIRGAYYIKNKPYNQNDCIQITNSIKEGLKEFLNDYAFVENLGQKDAFEHMVRTVLYAKYKQGNEKQSKETAIYTRAEVFEKIFGFKVDPKCRICGIIDCKGQNCDTSCKFKNMKPDEFWNAPYESKYKEIVLRA